MRIFVTGASGYIGTALSKELLAHGHTVVGLARSDASAEAIKALGAEVQRGNIDDLDVLRAAAAASDGVAHLAFDHELMLRGDHAGATAKDIAVVTGIGEALAGTNKPFVISSATLLVGPVGPGSDENTPAPLEGAFNSGRASSEQFVGDLAQKGVRSGIVRLPPTVHGGDLQAFSFTKQLIATARKHGYAGYANEQARWPAANVFDVAVLYRLVLEKGEPGRRYHATADEGNRLRDIAGAIGAHLGIPVKPVPEEEVAAHFGFLSRIVGTNNLTPSALTREWTGWTPKYPGLVEELKAGKCFD
jgi:nucleoside-diphosphate-sugar epimerase